MHFFQPKNYFWRLLTTIGVVSIIFQLITLSTLAYFMVVPLGQRAAGDLANVMVHAAETWHALAPSERPEFVEKMKSQHELLMSDAEINLDVSNSFLPYLHFLEKALENQLKQEIPLKQSISDDGSEWFWADIPIAGSLIRLGFERSRIGVNPPIAFILLITIGLYLTVMTAVKLTRRLTVPIERLHQAAQALGKGQWPDKVKIDGPEELNVLAREFNRMSTQVRALLSNRTTLLAGIAHDLRTPLTQIQLALAMLPDEGGDPELMKSIQTDLHSINHLISETLSISMELEEGEEVMVEIGGELNTIIKNIHTNGLEIRFSPGKLCQCSLHPLALRRIITNLLVNAVRYGDNKPIEVSYGCNDKEMTIQILDHGPGIPPELVEAVFRPFYRLEKSRGTGTGGSGLGLAIVRQLADANDWEVLLLPVSGGGTNAVLTIPCVGPDVR